MPFAAIQRQPEISYQVKLERQVSYDAPYMWNLKYGTNKPTYRTETD